jgi:hypothetical protein
MKCLADYDGYYVGQALVGELLMTRFDTLVHGS